MPAIDTLSSRIGDAIANVLANTANPALDVLFKASAPRAVTFNKTEVDHTDDQPFALIIFAGYDPGPNRYRNTKRKTRRYTIRFTAYDYQYVEDMEMVVEQAMEQVFGDPNTFFATIDDQEGNLVAKDGILEPTLSIIGVPADDKIEVECTMSITTNDVNPPIDG